MLLQHKMLICHMSYLSKTLFKYVRQAFYFLTLLTVDFFLVPMNISHNTSVLEFFNDHRDKSYYLCTTLNNSCATRAQLVHNS